MDITSKQRKKIIKYILDDRRKKLSKYINKEDIPLNSILNSKGEKMVHICCREGACDCLEYLVKSGARVNLVDRSGNLPIHNAIQYCMENYSGELESDLVSYLLTYSTSLLNIQNNKGVSARQLLETLESMKQNGRERDAANNYKYEESGSEDSSSDEKRWEDRLRDEYEAEYEGSFARFENESEYLYDEPENFDAWADKIYASFSERRRRAYAPPPSKSKHVTTSSSNSTNNSYGFTQPKKRLGPQINPAQSQINTEKLRQEKRLRKVRELSNKLFNTNEQISFADLPYVGMNAHEILDAMLGGLSSSDNEKDDVKKVIREEVRRWHPDKFKQKVGPRIESGDSDKVLDEVKRVAQAILSYAK